MAAQQPDFGFTNSYSPLTQVRTMVQRKVPASKITKTSESKRTRTNQTGIVNSPAQSNKVLSQPPKPMQIRRTQGK
jgi:hypothetical protein